MSTNVSSASEENNYEEHRGVAESIDDDGNEIDTRLSPHGRAEGR